MQYLVIASIPENLSKRDVVPQIRPEAMASWKLWESEMMRAVWYKADMSGAVMVLDAPSMKEIEEALDTLPMIHEGLLKPEIIPLKSYTGWDKLFAKES